MKKSLNNMTVWIGKKKKISILVPTRDTVHTQFAYCLTQLVKTTSEAGYDVYVFFDSSTILLNQREKLIDTAISINSDYVIWLDSDMVFPPSTILRLLAHNTEIVGCNYMRRTKPEKTVAYLDITNWDSWLPMEPKSELIEVEGVGLGCMLMETKVFEKLEKPYFIFSYKEATKDWMGEDFNLLFELRMKGSKIYIDTVLSMELKHLGTYAF